MTTNDMDFNVFLSNKKDELKSFAFLFGNGFPKSSPDLEGKGYFDISDEDYRFIWNTVNSRVLNFIAPNKTREETICPEELLNHIRLIYGIEIFRLYLKKQKDLASQDIKRPREFLKKFKSIYTLNYDLFSYVCQFDPKSHQSNPNTPQYLFSDGFSNKPIELEKIKERQKENEQNKENPQIPYYYVHGAFHIFYKPCCRKYEKILSNGRREEFPDKIIKKYDEINATLYQSQPGIKILDQLDDPLIVFSSRSTYKGGVVSDDLYLKYCLDSLSEENKVFTFGCSFANDTHILKELTCNKTKKEKEIFIGYYTDEDKKSINKFINEYGEKCSKRKLSKVTFVNVGGTQKDDVQKYIWQPTCAS